MAEFDPARFAPRVRPTDHARTRSPAASSTSPTLGQKGTFLFDAQVHKANADPELVEEGQLLRMTVQAWGQVYRITD